MTDPEHAQALLQDAADFARKAVQYDQAGQVDTAVFYYTVRGDQTYRYLMSTSNVSVGRWGGGERKRPKRR